MPKDKNKVKFDLKRAYYAVATVDETTGAVTYGTPTRIPGAVLIAMSPEGNLSTLRADGCDYYVGASNNGYSGDMEFALIPDSFKVDCLGESLDETAQVIIEKSTAQPTPFALLFEFSQDRKNTRHVMYMCYASRPSVEAENPDAKEPKTEKLTIRAVPREIDDLVKAKTGENTTDTVYNDWYKSVWVPASSTATA